MADYKKLFDVRLVKVQGAMVIIRLGDLGEFGMNTGDVIRVSQRSDFHTKTQKARKISVM